LREVEDVRLNPRLRAHWRTLAGVTIGAVLGGAYAHFIGCRTGTCLLTGNVWIAAAFFGFTGGVVGFPGPSGRERPRAEPGEAPPR
jgi:hypothetical protein